MSFAIIHKSRLSAARLRIAVCAAFTLLVISQCQSQFRSPQVEITNSDTVGYGFLSQDNNELENRAHLEPFFQKLYIQRTQGGQKVSVVHIGDSHILGNYLTHEMRARMQRQFGDAGRGFIFPYKLADSYGPRDYLVESPCRAHWRGSNCQADLSTTTPFGISGYCLETTNPACSLTIRLRDTATSETRLFTKVTIFHRKTPLTFALDVRDDVSNQTAQLFLEDEFSASYYFDRPVSQFSLFQRRTDANQKNLALDGIAIENELSGVLYHSIGVNGGKYGDYLRAEYFAAEVGRLNPDLIIISLGTNEAQGRMDLDVLYKQIADLTAQLREQAPNASFLFTTPADSYLRGRGANPYMAGVSATIARFARDEGYALWDLFTLSGGENSAQQWKARGLLSTDSVHYTKIGYAVQGKLFYQSVIRGYNEFVETRQ